MGVTCADSQRVRDGSLGLCPGRVLPAGASGWLMRMTWRACRQGVADSKAEATCWGPQYQGQFLQSLGIAARLEALLDAAADADEQEALYRGAMRLVTGPRPCSLPLDGSAPKAASAPAQAETRDGAAEAVQSRQREGEEAGHESDGEAPEGLGYQYMAMAITPARQEAPVPFTLS